MKLDVVVPSYNRSRMLRRTLDSLMMACVPDGLQVTVIVADNNSTDDTEQVVRAFQQTAIHPTVYVKEARQGSSYARNAGIAAGDGVVIGFIDDDEEVDAHWYEVIAREFSDDQTQFIGGPYLGNWAAPAPSWLPEGYHSVIGVIPPKPRSSFGPDCDGILMGGNAVIRRTVFERIGTYSTKLGRTNKGLLSDEDAEFFGRLMRENLCGMYVPDLVIYHHVPPERLTRRYHRRWCYWRGVSQGYADRESPEQGPRLFGVPRHRFGHAARRLIALPMHLASRSGKAQAVADELAAWGLLGFVYGKYFFRGQ